MKENDTINIDEEPWNLEDLGPPPDSILYPEGYDKEKEDKFFVSSGWFPKPASYIYEISYYQSLSLFPINIVNNLRSSHLVPTVKPFTSNDPYDDSDNKKIKKAFSDDDEDDDEHSTGSGYFGFLFSTNPGLPFNLFSTISFVYNDVTIYTDSEIKAFLNYDNEKEHFKETSVLNISEYGIGFSAGIEIPVYGAYLTAMNEQIGSAYYISAAISGNYYFDSDVLQYSQIIDNKGNIRYGNGSDTLTVLNDKDPESVNKLRWSYEIGLGMNFFSRFSFRAELLFNSLITPILIDAPLKQHNISLKFTLGGIKF